MKQQTAFSGQLAGYKTAIDADIAVYAAHVRQTTLQQYGEHAAAVTDAYLSMLSNGGKRLRGALVMVGYEMCGGTDATMITRAATALEMIHAYILTIDDIQDRSTLRRGRPTVHKQLTNYHHDRHLKGDAAHAGISLALNAALTGAHAAQMLLAGLSVDAERKVKVLGIVNHTMIVTAHGQTTDIMNELLPKVESDDVRHALEWKTAHYTMLNPLCVGMVLAGAGCEDTNAIRDYALQTGRAFQITDDIMGLFGTDEQTGKGTLDDIREGKQTMLTMYALEHATSDDKAFLQRCLGNPALTKTEFVRIQQIIRATGALDYAQQEAQQAVQAALSALQLHAHRWPTEQVMFLQALATTLLARTE